MTGTVHCVVVISYSWSSLCLKCCCSPFIVLLSCSEVGKWEIFITITFMVLYCYTLWWYLCLKGMLLSLYCFAQILRKVRWCYFGSDHVCFFGPDTLRLGRKSPVEQGFWQWPNCRKYNSPHGDPALKQRCGVSNLWCSWWQTWLEQSWCIFGDAKKTHNKNCCGWHKHFIQNWPWDNTMSFPLMTNQQNVPLISGFVC